MTGWVEHGWNTDGMRMERRIKQESDFEDPMSTVLRTKVVGIGVVQVEDFSSNRRNLL